MNRTAGIFWLGALLLVLFPRAGNAQAAAKPTIWDGIYTEAQATRGKQTVQVNCAACHNAADWESTGFMTTWTGQPIGELHSWIRSTMPLDGPGRLSAQEYADILAYMLKLNRAPAGKAELRADGETMAKIQVTRRTTR